MNKNKVEGVKTNDMEYIFTRLSIEGIASVYLAINETTSPLEIIKPKLILDNELIGEEVSIEVSSKDFTMIREYFEETHGKKLPNIEVEKLNIVRDTSLGLEKDNVFVTIEESKSDTTQEMLYTMTLTDMLYDRTHTIEISKEVFVSLWKMV